ARTCAPPPLPGGPLNEAVCPRMSQISALPSNPQGARSAWGWGWGGSMGDVPSLISPLRPLGGHSFSFSRLGERRGDIWGFRAGGGTFWTCNFSHSTAPTCLHYL
uniref:Uncharacterized protein n=1 Tax=Catagonus wagneri TaxID=51154 RepID=A0A8C3WJ82_9CETA